MRVKSYRNSTTSQLQIRGSLEFFPNVSKIDVFIHAGDNVDPQPIDVLEVPTPPPPHQKAHSFEDSDARRKQ